LPRRVQLDMVACVCVWGGGGASHPMERLEGVDPAGMESAVLMSSKIKHPPSPGVDEGVAKHQGLPYWTVAGVSSV
jgi:hypothetical protein